MRPTSVNLLPFKGDFKGYTRSSFFSDFASAIAVSLLTIPQSIAYSILAGLPPTAGIFSAIFGTLFTAAFGSSRHLVSGPSTGVSILLQTSLAGVLAMIPDLTVETREQVVYTLLTQLVVLIGIIQIVAGCFNVSKLLQFVSRPVILGYFSGIAVAIVINQLPYFLGIPSAANQSIARKGASLLLQFGQFDWAAALIGMAGIASLIILKRCLPRFPHPLLMLIIAIFLARLVHWSSGASVESLGDYSQGISSAPHFIFPILNFHWINALFPSAMAIAFLGMLEVFSISRQFAARSGQQIAVNQDVFGLGVGNFLLSFLTGSLPASGSATRTALNYDTGAKTRLAALMSGLLTSLIVYFCWPWVELIPLAALAALLLATVPSMLNFKEIAFTFRATKEDAWVFLLTFISCVIFSLDTAFFLGIGMSLATYLRKSSVPHLVEYSFNSKGRLMVVSPKEQPHRHIRIIGIGGELYFASADVFQAALQSIAEDEHVRVIVLRLNNVHNMDASMCMAISQLQEQLKNGHRYLVISGLTEEVWHVLHRAGLVKQIGLDNLYFTDESNPQFSTWKACLRAQELIHKTV